MAFDIVKYLEENKIEMGSIKKEVGTHISKGGHNDLRKTSYDVKIVDGKFDLSTHKTVVTESKKSINEVKQGSTSEIAEIYARFLMGDREVAIKQLKSAIGTRYGNPKPGGTAEWNAQFAELIKKLTVTINTVL